MFDDAPFGEKKDKANNNNTFFTEGSWGKLTRNSKSSVWASDVFDLSLLADEEADFYIEKTATASEEISTVWLSDMVNK